MGDTDDEACIGRLVVDRGYVTQKELNECLQEQKRLKGEGHEVSLAEVMIRKNYVTRSQLQRLGEAMEDSIHRSTQQIPGFQILGKIGQGDTATVFKAKQLSFDRVVAIKVLPKKLSENAQFVERFYRQGQTLARLHHDNIVQAVDMGEANGYHYFVMEYVDSRTVYDELAAGKIYRESEALKIIVQIARAIEYLADHGFVHRGIKPKSILLTKVGTAKLVGFTLARKISDVKQAMAEAAQAFGDAHYMSPEQIRGEVRIDAAADIYSLGATFYHMITCKLPFEASTPAAVMHKHLVEPLIPPDHIVPSLSPAVGYLIEKMLAKNPKDRHSTPQELVRDLEALIRGESRLTDEWLCGGEQKDLSAHTETPDRAHPRRVVGFYGLLILSLLANAVLLFLLLRP